MPNPWKHPTNLVLTSLFPNQLHHDLLTGFTTLLKGKFIGSIVAKSSWGVSTGLQLLKKQIKTLSIP